VGPGQGRKGRTGSTAEVEVERDVSRLAQKPLRLLKGVQALIFIWVSRLHHE